MTAQAGSAPQSTTFTGNNVSTFDASLAELVVGAGVTVTTVNGGHRFIFDQSVGTVVTGGYHTP